MTENPILAAVDIGTNSIRLLVAEVPEPGKIIPQYKHTITTRLGEGMTTTNALSDAAIERTIAALEQIKALAQDHHAQRIMAYATAAVREAQNQDEFIRRVHKRTQLLVDVLSGQREAQCSFTGIPGSGLRCSVDIGGGSTDVALGRDDEPLAAVSVKLGCVRAKEIYPLGDIADQLTLAALRQWADHGLKEPMNDLMAQLKALGDVSFVGVGGTCTTLAALDQAMATYDPAKVHGYVLKRERVEALVDRLAHLTYEERKALPGMKPNRADIIINGAVILLAFMDRTGAQSIRVSEWDNLEGYLLQRG